MMAPPRNSTAEEAGGPLYVVSIDLGTTNSAVAYVDLKAPNSGRSAIKSFAIPQLAGPGEFRPMPVLPSFLYIPGEFEIDPQAFRHPWPKSGDAFVGLFARDQGAKVPARLVSSAKSWLCHGGVDRNARILPWGAPAEVAKVSPVQASAAYLEHIKQAWNHTHGNEEEFFLENQKVILTVPASFDEVARELTLAAAKLAGYRDITMIEEPLAAFYSWIATHEYTWQDHIGPNQLILICDVGGGTTDFTLVTLTAAEGGNPRFERIAVGDHLILGGDNVDLALARRVEAQWGAKLPALDADRWKTLCHHCRQAKETILSGQAQQHRITLMGGGSRLIAGTITADLDRTVVEETLLDGFFPLVEAETQLPPAQRPAITELGLPYESEPAVTRHLYRFLERHRGEVATVTGKQTPLPDHVLFNGGSLKPRILQERICEAARRWFAPQQQEPPRILENPDHDLAVALGAAYYGLVKMGRGVRVGSGSPRAYYLGVSQSGAASGAADTPQQAICIVERGLDEGSRIELGENSFQVLANQPVRFDLFSSSFRSRDRCGTLLTVDDTMVPLPPLQTVIQFGKKGAKTAIPVHIEAEYTEMGTLAIWCRSMISDHRWQLQFQLRESVGAGEVREETVLEAAVLTEAEKAVEQAFVGVEPVALDGLAKKLAAVTQLNREEWPMALIRRLADTLLKQPQVRSKSATHEARWLNLLGFSLRPGFGDALDTERVKQAWKIFIQGMVRPKNAQVQSEWWIMWRRLAGGLTPGQQRQISQQCAALLQPKKGARSALTLQQRIEVWMTVANLERLYVQDKTQWGRLLLASLQPNQAVPQHFWTLARLGARELLYGPADRVIPAQEATRWIETLLTRPWRDSKPVGAALIQLARKTGDRTRDLSPAVIERILQWFEPHTELHALRRCLTEVVPIAHQEEQSLFGEALPTGIVLHGG